jgi:hypothetical protein
MKELDLLKRDWQKNNQSFTQVTDKEIYIMIHKNSSSIVKWIFIISILEIVFWTVIGLFLNTENDLKELDNAMIYPIMEGITVLNYAVVLIFIYLFYKNYSQISTINSTKQLMKDIIKTRKTVQYYVWYNLGMFILGAVLGITLALSYDPTINNLKQNIQNPNLVLAITIVSMIVFCSVLYGAIWLFYKLAYGILLKKLNTNYQELKKLDF